MRTQELERDRLWLVNMHENDEGVTLWPRERRTSLRHQLERRLLQMDLYNLPEAAPLGSLSSAKAASQPNPRSQYTTHLIPKTIHSLHSPRYRQNSQPPSPSSPLQKTKLETQYEQHETRQFPRDTSDGLNKNTTTLALLKDKVQVKSSGSWIRRFSMPVGNHDAFNIDSKRHQSNNSSVSSSTTSNYSMGSGVSSGPVQIGGGKGLFSMNARKNVSTTALVQIPGDSEGRNRVQEGDQLRSGGTGIGIGIGRSYEAAGQPGLRNRSMTNLKLLREDNNFTMPSLA